MNQVKLSRIVEYLDKVENNIKKHTLNLRTNFLTDADKSKLKDFTIAWFNDYFEGYSEEDFKESGWVKGNGDQLVKIMHTNFDLETVLKDILTSVKVDNWINAEILETNIGNYATIYDFDKPVSLEDSLTIIVYSHIISYLLENIDDWVW